MILPPTLQLGDTISIVAVSGRIDPEISEPAAAFLSDYGFRVRMYPTATSSHHYFSGTEAQRLQDLQEAIDDDSQAILFARGGYGAMHLLDKVDFSKLKAKPKWLIGFSDITAIHACLNNIGLLSLHAGMAKEFAVKSENAEANIKVLMGHRGAIEWDATMLRNGSTKGKLIGGNLSVLAGLMGTPFLPDFNNAVLFIEDLGEPLYKIDRMLQQFKLAGIFKQLKGLIIGQFTDISDTTVPFGKSLKEIVLDACANYDFPIAFDFPAGHDEVNVPFILGADVSLNVQRSTAILEYV